MSLARSAFIFCIILSLGNVVPFGENTFAWALSSRATANTNSRTSGATFEENNLIPGVRSIKPLAPVEPLLPLKDVIQCAEETSSKSSSNDPDIKRNTQEILEAQGYQVETHKVQTADGYILTLFRIPRGKDEGVLPTASKKAVLVNHGLLGSSAQWVVQKGNKNLAMKLADAGYDVWLNNHRGTSYSTEHVNLTQNDVEYWDFSWHEMGVYDVPAIIDYMLDVTKNPKIFYVGHSQGTTQFLIAMSEREEYNDKIEVAFLLAPIAYLANVPSKGLKKVASITYYLQDLFVWLLGGKIQLNFLTKYYNTSIGQLCAETQSTCLVCAYIPPLIGMNGRHIDYPRLDVMLSKYPDSASTKCAVHYAQNMHHSPASFRQFDYLTPAKNEKRYGPGITEPPAYNLSKVVTKVIGVYADNDKLGDPKDVAITMSKLGNSTKQNELVRVDDPNFSHVDFAFAEDADYLVYNNILEVMNNS